VKIINLHLNNDLLLSLVCKKDRRAQEQLYQLFAPKMLSVCRYYLKSLPKAEEAMLNGFLKVFQNIESFKNEGSFEGWIRQIMVRECLSMIRIQAKLQLFSDEKQPFDIQKVEPHDALEYDYYQSLIDALPDGYRVVFVLYCIEGYKHQEIAKILNIKIGTSKSQLNRARQMLQTQIKKDNHSNYVVTKI